MTNIILDTHILYWYVNQIDQELPTHIKNQLDTADTIYTSAICCMEMAWLVKHGRIKLDLSYEAWFKLVQDETNIQILPVNAEIANSSVALPEHHKDPHDRLIIATALHHNYQLASLDSKFKSYSELDELLIY